MTKQYQVPLTGSVERINRKIREFLFCFFFVHFVSFQRNSNKNLEKLYTAYNRKKDVLTA